MNQLYTDFWFEKILETNAYLKEEAHKNKINRLQGRMEMRLKWFLQFVLWFLCPGLFYIKKESASQSLKINEGPELPNLVAVWVGRYVGREAAGSYLLNK